MADVNTLIDSVQQLPTLPSASAQLIGMLGSDDVTISDIAEIVRLDEALVTAVIRYANSVGFGTSSRKFDLRESIVRLGHSTISRIVLEQQAASVFSAGCDSFELTREALWRCAIGGALAAEEFAGSHQPDLRDYAFVGALMCDIGKLVLDMHLGGQYAQSVYDNLTGDRAFTDAEREAFGLDHAEVGAALCRRWELPEAIALAVEFHHDPPEEAPEHGALINFVHAGDIIALWSGIAVGSDGLRYELAPHVKRALKLSRRTAEQAIASMWDALRDIESALGMNENKQRSAA